MTTPNRSTLPTSRYDAIATDLRPFGWSTPADPTATPWRVSHADHLAKLLEKHGQPDLYVTPWVAITHGNGLRLSLWVGLRDNANAHNHGIRLRALVEAMRADGLVVREVKPRGYAFVTHLMVIDDLDYAKE